MRLCYGFVVAAAVTVCQLGENMSATPMAPPVFFQPLSSCFAYPGFNEQCRQCEQDWGNTTGVVSRMKSSTGGPSIGHTYIYTYIHTYSRY